MIYYGFDYVAQIGSLLIALIIVVMIVHFYNRFINPIIERIGMVERVKMAMYDKELEAYCKENKIDYSKIDVKLNVCYKKKNNKLKERLQEIENGF